MDTLYDLPCVLEQSGEKFQQSQKIWIQHINWLTVDKYINFYLVQRNNWDTNPTKFEVF